MCHFSTSLNKNRVFYAKHFRIINLFQQTSKGYVLSKEALHRFVGFALKGNITKGICNHKRDAGNEDVEMGLCLNSVGVHSVDTRDKLGKHRFHSDTPLYWLASESWSAAEQSYPFYPVKKVI